MMSLRQELEEREQSRVDLEQRRIAVITHLVDTGCASDVIRYVSQLLTE
jgi:hypothetical protein